MNAHSDDAHRPATPKHRALRSLLTLFICLVFTFLMIHNQVLPLDSIPYSVGIKGQDSGQMIWNVWHTSEAVAHGQNPYRTNLLFYPQGSNLAHHSLAPGFFPITLLVKLFTGNSPLYPIYAYRIIILISFTLLFFFTYRLLRELGFTSLIAATMGVAYAFCDFYMLHFIHLNHIAGFFIPLTGWLLVRWYKRPGFSRLLAVAISASAAAYFSEFTVYIYLAALLMLLILMLVRTQREQLWSRVQQTGLRNTIVASGIFVTVLASFLYLLFTDDVRKPRLYEISHCSANLAGFVVPGGQEVDEPVLYQDTNATPLYGKLFSSLESRLTVGHGGYEGFVGFPLLLFSLVGILTTRSGLVRVSFVLAVVFLLLSLGPTLKVLGTETGISMPYALIMNVPPFSAGRTPVRFMSMALLPLVIVGAVGLSRLTRLVEARVNRTVAKVLVVIVFVWTAAEAYSPVKPGQRFEPPSELKQLVAGPVLHVPPVQWDGYAALLQTQHQQPIDTGHVARNSESQYSQFQEIRRAFDRGGSYFCQKAKQLGFSNVLIKPASVVLPYKYSLLPLRLEGCDINVVDLRKLDAGSSDEHVKTFPEYAWGTRVEFGGEDADKYLWYGWSGREPWSRWTDRGSAALVFQLPNVQPAQLQIRMAAFVLAQLPAQRVSLSINGYRVADLTLTNKEAADYTIELPLSVLARDNELVLELPDAEYPSRLGVSSDTRLLGVNVQSIQINPVATTPKP